MKLALEQIRLDLLRHFHEIAVNRSLSEAARHLNLTPSAVTHSLARLESQLGTRLCARGRSGFRLTGAGRRLLQSTQKVFGELRIAVQELQAGEYHGVVSIGMLNNLVDKRIDRAIIDMIGKFPAAKFALISSTADDINRRVQQGDLHAGIGIFFHHAQELSYRKIGAQQLAYFVARGHRLWAKPRISRSDLFGEDLAWLDSERRTVDELESNIFRERAHYKMRVAAYANSVEGAVRILLGGRAVVPLPPAYVDGFALLRNRKVRRLMVATNSPKVPIELAYDARMPMVAPVARLMDTLSRGWSQKSAQRREKNPFARPIEERTRTE